MTSNDDLPLTTQRVSSSRRAPLAVLLVAAAAVTLLIWRPWDRPTATVPTSSPAVAAPTATPTAAPSHSVPTPTLPPTPSPATPTPTPQLVDIAVAPAYVADGFVLCTYLPAGDASQTLDKVIVRPLTVSFRSSAVDLGIRRIRLRFEIQTNRLDTLFSADWQTLRRPRVAIATRVDVDAIGFPQTTLDYEAPVGPTVVARVVLTVKWYDRDLNLLGSRDLVPTSYSHGDNGALLPEGCHTLI